MSPAAPPDLRSFTGYLLRRAYVRSTGVAQACITDDTRLRELGALSALAEQGPVPQRRLSELIQISPTLVVKLVDELERKGLATRERSATDRRVQTVRVTALGAAAVLSQRVNLEIADTELTSGLTRAETRRLKRHLTAVLDGNPVVGASPLSGYLGYLIAHAHHQLRDEGSRRMAELDLHPRDFGLLTTLARNAPCSQARLAEGLGVSPPAVLALLDVLEERGLVSRARSPQDRRSHDVTLTAEGRRLLGRAQRAAGQIQREIRDRLGPEADEDLRELLAKLIA